MEEKRTKPPFTQGKPAVFFVVYIYKKTWAWPSRLHMASKVDHDIAVALFLPNK